MRIVTNIIVSFCFISLGYSQNKDIYGYPYFEEVVNNFFDNYSTSKKNTYESLSFHKKKEGWVVATINFKENKVVKSNLFWSRRDMKYKKTPFPKASNDSISEYDKQFILKEWTNRYYSFFPYYGYSGYEWDIIEEYKDSVSISDSTLYALGRAYSSYSKNLLKNKDILIDEHHFNLSEGLNSMSEEQLSIYRNYSRLSLKMFERLRERDPNFMTIVGSIDTKISNDYMDNFLKMRMYQSEKEAKVEFDYGTYKFSDVLISTAKNYLTSCPKNTILFTGGDNDTYPLIYVQEKMGFRTDVLIVNISLLNDVRYLFQLKENNLASGKLYTTVDLSKFDNNKRSYFLFYKNDNYANLLNVINEVRNGNDEYEYNKSINYYLLSNKLAYTVNDSLQLFFEIDKNYIYRSELIVLDIICTNNFKRPICFEITCGEAAYLGLNDYLDHTGLCYIISTSQSDSSDSFTGEVDVEVMYENVMSKFSWDFGNDFTSNDYLFLDNYRNMFARLIEKLIKEKQHERAKNALSKCESLLPNSLINYGINTLYLIRCYYELGDFETGGIIAKQLAYNFINGLTPTSKVRYIIDESTEDSKLPKLIKLLEEYKQYEVLSEIKEMQKP